MGWFGFAFFHLIERVKLQQQTQLVLQHCPKVVQQLRLVDVERDEVTSCPLACFRGGVVVGHLKGDTSD